MLWRRPGRRLLNNLSGRVSAVYILVLVIVALVGPLVISKDPSQISRSVLKPPSPSAWFGTDQLGRDQLARLVDGARVSLLVGVVAAGMAVIVGVLVGAFAGFFGGWLDIALMRVSEFFQVMPTLIVAVAIVALIGPGLFNIILVIAMLSWPQTARVTRGEVLRVKQLEYIDVARCQGRPEWRILLREVIPNAIPAVMPLIALCVAEAILQEASISFLGLGSPDTISWGLLLHDGQQNLLRAWWMSVIPGVATFITVLAFNLLGDSVSAALNPRLRLIGRVRRRVKI
ncbi:ABC transporter permease [Nakamurella lactea]|uniref:ABC transporter permease n=1 Tax=Nakamurella lactea TaxID=459515 RepID=UPI00040422E5|nr:ABC transporter permease [Nakamurella lactea]